MYVYNLSSLFNVFTNLFMSANALFIQKSLSVCYHVTFAHKEIALLTTIKWGSYMCFLYEHSSLFCLNLNNSKNVLEQLPHFLFFFYTFWYHVYKSVFLKNTFLKPISFTLRCSIKKARVFANTKHVLPCLIFSKND